MERKKPENVVPQPFHKLFASYDYFNEMQSALLDDLLNTDKSLVLSAPTGSGKTVAFELAIIQMLQKINSQQDQSNRQKILPKAVYIAPIKALCSEKFTDWKARFQTVGVTCTQLTGDTESSNLAAIREAQVVVSTPEKWDSLTRRWRDFEQLLPAVQLFIVDEVHLLNEDTRGPILEAVVARMKSSGVKRFLIASATIPNAVDLTSWLRGGGANLQVVQHVFSDIQRPVPLKKYVIGFNSKLRGFQFDMRLNYQLPDILRKYAEDKASLVFCSSRKSAEMAAFNLNKTASVFHLNENQKLYLSQLAPSILDVKLRKLVENGIAYHHAGLQYSDRGLIESSFRQGFLMVLISTSTLAMGINLPAHLVVIKSTETYSGGSYTEYAESVLLQMIGRAGRPQYDTKGVAVIMTQQKNVQKYQKLLNGTAPIESHLHKHLTEHINSEIALNTITSLEKAMVWVRSTYLYVRAVCNPKHYGFDAKLTKDFVEHKLEELCLRQINALQGAGLVKFDPLTGTHVRSTVYGQLMTKYYMSFETMKLFQQLIGKESLEDLLKLLVQCKEMSEFMLRVNEKKVLNELNKTPLRFPIRGRIKNNGEKISCIIQAVLGNIDIPAPGLVQESLKIMRIGDRVSKCLLEYVRLRATEATDSDDEPNNWYSTILNAITLAKCLHVKLWENSEFATKQLQGIGTVYSNTLAKFGITGLKSIAKIEARTIEKMLNKSAPFGDGVLKHLMSFPMYELNIVRKNNCFIQIFAKQVNEEYVHKGGATAVLILGDSLNNLLLLEENLNDIINEQGSYERLIKLEKANETEYVYGHVIHVSLVGVDAHAILEINPPKNVKTGDVSGGKAKPNSEKKQRLLNFSFNNSLFDTTSSDDSLNLDDILKNNETSTLANKILQQDDSINLIKEINSPVKENAKNNANQSNISEDIFELDKTATVLENFRFKKPAMKSSTSNFIVGKKRLDKTLVDETFVETLNALKRTHEFNATCKQNSAKQLKLTDFFNKCKKVEKVIENIDLTTSLKILDTTPKSSLKGKNENFQMTEKIANTSKLIRTPEDNDRSGKESSPFSTTQKDKNNSKDSSSSLHSSSDNIPLTVIPNPNSTILSKTSLNDSFLTSFTSNQKDYKSAAKRNPLTLASFLCDPQHFSKNEPMIKLADEQSSISKAKRKLFSDSFNEHKRSEQVEVSSIKHMHRSSKHKARKQCIETSMCDFKENKLRENEFSFDFEPQTNHDFDFLSICESVQKNTHKKRQTLLHSNSFKEEMQDTDDEKFNFMSKPNSSFFQITAKYEPNNKRKCLNNSSSEDSFQKLLCEESLLQSKPSDSPKTQSSPLDLSKIAIFENKSKLLTNNFVEKENKATQTNFAEYQKQTPTKNDFKLWHEVALQFSKVPLVQAQSLSHFQTVYNKVRQKLQPQQTEIRLQKAHRFETLKASKETNKSAQNSTFNPIGDRNQSSSNLKIKQNSTFRLQLFDDQNEPKECPQLNRREIKLINQNVMSLVLEKKCKENDEPSEYEISHRDSNEVEAELDKLERELELSGGKPFI